MFGKGSNRRQQWSKTVNIAEVCITELDAGECVFQCQRCHLDTRDDAVGFGHAKCVCAPLPAEEKPKIECPHNALRKVKIGNYTFTAYICGNCSQMFEVNKHEELEPIKEPMFDTRPPWGLRDRQA